MDELAVVLARIQFGFTAGFHYLFPPLSIGLGVFLVMAEGIYLKTKNPIWHQVARFWTKIFALTFAVGVATGIVLEFEFGTNWATYSRYVGDVFGSALAAEGIFAFFLESGFLAVLLFGWDKVPPLIHYFSTIMVALGAHFSAVWIVVANSWMQTPAGFHIVDGPLGQRAEITDFWAMVFNPSSMERLTHVLLGAWLAGACLVLSVSAWYLLKKKHPEFARSSLKLGLVFALVACLLQVVSGHSTAVGVAKNQPAKLAALEGHFKTDNPAHMYLIGIVDTEKETVHGIYWPNGLSWMLHHDPNVPVQGLDAVPKEDHPPVQAVFQTYHAMVASGVLMVIIFILAAIYLARGNLHEKRWLLWILVFSVLLPQIANECGWIAAEMGRQPWIVYDLLRTKDAISMNVPAGHIIFSLIFFGGIYSLLLYTFLYLMNNKIQNGPDPQEVRGPILGIPKQLRSAMERKGRVDE